MSENPEHFVSKTIAALKKHFIKSLENFELYLQETTLGIMQHTFGFLPISTDEDNDQVSFNI